MILDDFSQITCEKTPQSQSKCTKLPNTYHKTCTNHVRAARTPKQLPIGDREVEVGGSQKSVLFWVTNGGPDCRLT